RPPDAAAGRRDDGAGPRARAGHGRRRDRHVSAGRPAARVGVAIATRGRRERLLATLPRLLALPERPPVVVADNGSADGSAAAVRAAFGGRAAVLAPGRSRGGAARAVAARARATPYVGFSDDDSWWAPGALARAADLLDARPRVGLLAAHVVVGPRRRP